MTLILNNAEIESLLDMRQVIDTLEQAYRAMGEQRALNRPRTDLYLPGLTPTSSYAFKSMEGAYPDGGVVALRLCSDTIAWNDYAGAIRKDKPPTPEGYWIGLVLLFSTITREPIAIMPDGVMQKMRVAAANALGVRYMARPEASVYGLLGSGWQAGAQVQAFSMVRNLKEVRVFSPNSEHRQRFANDWGERLGLNIRAVDSAREAVAGADIVGVATSAASPVMQADWVEPGMHLSCIKRSELGEHVLARCHRVAVHTQEGAPFNWLSGLGGRMIKAHDPIAIVRKLQNGEHVSEDELAALGNQTDAYPGEPELADLVVGRAKGYDSPEQVTAFVNNIGLGLQFAAIGGLIHQRARECRVGREVPTEWFMEREPC
jgi:ornithine cyclodeaminase/alanine dehydrogenase-like protein (mu-crystallin family)